MAAHLLESLHREVDQPRDEVAVGQPGLLPEARVHRDRSEARQGVHLDALHAAVRLEDDLYVGEIAAFIVGTLFDLLGAPEVGITLTENCAMQPAASVSGLYFAHTGARYFSVGRIGRDQLEDYARRKGMTIEDAERWLAPNL